MQDATVVNTGIKKTKLIVFSVNYYKWKLCLESIKHLYANPKAQGVLTIKPFINVLFLCFFTSMFPHNKKLEFLKQTDSTLIKKQDSRNNLTHLEIQKLKSYSIEAAQIKKLR